MSTRVSKCVQNPTSSNDQILLSPSGAAAGPLSWEYVRRVVVHCLIGATATRGLLLPFVVKVLVDNCLAATAIEDDGEYEIGRRAACAATRTIEREDMVDVGIIVEFSRVNLWYYFAV